MLKDTEICCVMKLKTGVALEQRNADNGLRLLKFSGALIITKDSFIGLKECKEY